jgi:hypothetical protein
VVEGESSLDLLRLVDLLLIGYEATLTNKSK